VTAAHSVRKTRATASDEPKTATETAKAIAMERLRNAHTPASRTN
jgi:hypothetical protein